MGVVPGAGPRSTTHRLAAPNAAPGKPAPMVYPQDVSKKRAAIRFAVGSPEGPRAAVCRLWSSGDHVFMSTRLYGHIIKASLHKSGKWRWGFTEAYTARESSLLPSGGDRALHKWDRPSELFPGIISAFEIIVPSTELTTPRRRLSEEAARKYLSKVRWVSPASPEGETHFRVLFIASDSPTTVNNEVIWQHELSNGETVCLIAYEQPTTSRNKEYLASAKREILREVGKVAEDTALAEARETRGYLLGSAEDGTRFLVDISTDFLFVYW